MYLEDVVEAGHRNQPQSGSRMESMSDMHFEQLLYNLVHRMKTGPFGIPLW